MRKAKKRNLMIVLGIVLVVIAVVLMLVFLLSGKTTRTGGEVKVIKDETLSCTSETISYPYLRYDNSSKKKLTINAIFNKDELSKISLIEELYYDDKNMVVTSEAQNHVEIDNRTGKEGVNVNMLEPSYSVQDEKMVMTFFTEGTDFNGGVVKYYLADGLDNTSKKESFLRKYENKGFTCISR